MSDTALGPSLGVALIQFVGTSATTQDALQVPPGFDKLPTGSLLQGYVVNRDPSNNPILRTSLGDILVKTDVFIKTGSEVVMRVVNLTNNSSARIVSVDGNSIQQLQHQQDQQALQAKQDMVLQSSMSTASTPPSTYSASSTPGFLLEGVVLDISSAATKPQMMSAILNVPYPVAKAISEGAPVQFRVISSNLSLENANLSRPPTTVAEQAQRNVQQATFYQVYSKITGAPALATRVPIPAAPLQATPPSLTQPSGAPAASAPTTLPNTPVTGSPAPLNIPVHQAPVTATIPASAPVIPANSTALPSPALTSLATNIAANTPAVSTSATATDAPALPSLPAKADTITPQTPPPASENVAPKPAAMATGKLVSPQLLEKPELEQAARAVAAENLSATTPSKLRPESLMTSTSLDRPITTTPMVGDMRTPHTHTPRAGIMNATVIGSESGGATIVRTPIGTIKLFTATPPPVNSVLQLEVVFTPSQMQTSAAGSASATSVSLSSSSNLLNDWASLSEMQSLLQANPALARDLADRLPNTKSKLVNGALFFLSALRSGDMGSWLGRKLPAEIEKLLPQAAKQLNADFAALKTMTTTESGQPWQLFSFPVAHENELHQARLYVRNDEEKEKEGRAKSGTRFVLDINLSRMGDIQLDGLSRQIGGQLLFDLIFRSMVDLPQSMRDDLTQLYAHAAKEAQFTGTISFQNTPESFVHPLEEIISAQHANDGSIIA